MNTLGLSPTIIEVFQKHGTVVGSSDVLTYVRTAGSQNEMIEKALEELRSIDPDAVAYHVVIGEIPNVPERYMVCNVLFVSSHREDWPYERPTELRKGTFSVQCLAYNCTVPEFTDIGICQFTSNNIGLKRIR